MSDLLLLFIGAFTGIFVTALWVGTSMRERECEIFQKAIQKDEADEVLRDIRRATKKELQSIDIIFAGKKE